MSPSKTKLTVSIDKDVLDKAKKAAEEKNVSVSRAIENFLKFLANPQVYCFKCGDKFNTPDAELCPKCGWLACPSCGVCRCGLSEDAAVAVFHMRRVYEDLLSGRVKG